MRSLIAIVLVGVIATSCSGAAEVDGETVGIVSEVTGDLVAIESFVVLDSNGNSHKFTPGEGMTVDGGPPSHLRDHLLSGELVRVMYHKGSDGELIADDVFHG